MSQDLSQSDRTNFLDGSVSCPRQNSDGKIEDEAMTEFKSFILARYSCYEPYISYDDMLHLWDMESEVSFSHLPTRDRIIAQNRKDDILAKIDFDEVRKKFDEERRIIIASRPKNSYQKDLGPREFTFTYSPNWKWSDDEARLRMKTAIEKIVKYYKHEFVQFRAVGEVGRNGLSHVHCLYELKGGLKITDKNFKRAYPMWNTSIKTGATGHQGGHHANVRTLSDFHGYIEKELASAWLDIKIESQEPTNASV